MQDRTPGAPPPTDRAALAADMEAARRQAAEDLAAAQAALDAQRETAARLAALHQGAQQ